MKTAVEWLAEQVNTAKWKFADITDREAIIEKAKEMEKQQIEKAHIDGGKNKRTAVKCYNETFKSE